MPDLSMLRLLKVATPLTAFTVCIPLRVPPDGLLAIATDTAAEEVVTVVPLGSSTLTVTVGLNAVPGVVLAGCCPKPSFEGALEMTIVKLPLTAVCGGLLPSLTWTVKVDVPVALGVPEIILPL